jgi:hypothetical protein
MFNTYEELKKEFFPECDHYDKLANTGDPCAISEAIRYYSEEVNKTLSELEEYFGIKKCRSSEYNENAAA